MPGTKTTGDAASARAEAANTLIAKYREEFDKLLATSRVKRGLTPKAGNSTADLEARLAKMKEKEAAILKKLGRNPDGSKA